MKARRLQTRIGHRPPIPPFWKRCWRRFSPAQQDRIKSIGWSASLHFLLLAGLATIQIATQAFEKNEIMVMYSNDLPSDVISLDSSFSIEEVEEPVLETLESLEPAAGDPLNDLSLIGTQLDVPKTDSAPEQDPDATALSGFAPASSVSALQTDEQRISETDRRVAAAGGALDGPVRISLIFNGNDDIDLHVRYQALGREQAQQGLFAMFGDGYIFYGRPRSEYAMLDVDANAVVVVPSPCENVIFNTVPKSANYTVAIHHYASRGPIEPTPYVVVVKYGKRTKTFKGEIQPKDGLKQIWQFRYSGRSSELR